VVVQDEAGRELARRRLPEGADGIARFHELVASRFGGDGEPDPAQVIVVIETDRGPWVKALAAAGYRVYAVNPKQAARHRETVAVSGKKDDFFDAGALADMGRTRRHQIRELAADSDLAEAVKIAARAHQKLIWGADPAPAADAVRAPRLLPRRAGRLRRPRAGGRGHPGAAGEGTGPGIGGEADRLAGNGGAPAGRGRGALAQRARDIRAVLRAPRLAQPAVIAEAYAASVQAQAAVVAALNVQAMEAKVSELFAVTLMPGSTCPSPASGTSPEPGSSASSATRPAATRPPRPAGTTPAPHR
jgi:hypothetical protein